MDNFERDLEDLLNMTDSDETSSSSNGGVFEANQPFVLELYELKKDEPGPEVTAPETKEAKDAKEAKEKRREKRKKKRKSQEANKRPASNTSSSLSDSIPSAPGEIVREEFYDAHGSYHALPENQQASAISALMLVQAHSEHGQDTKLVPEVTATTERPSTTPREPSTVNKPVTNPPE